MDKTFESIDKYFKGGISAKEKEEVEQRIAQDRDFQKEFQAYQHSQNAIERVIEKDLRESLKAWQANDGLMKDAPPAKLRIINSRRFMAIAASIVLLIGLSTFIWLGRQYNVRQLTQSYYQEENLNAFRGAADGLDAEFAPGLLLLKEKKYSEALTFFNQLSQNADYHDIAQYYLGSIFYLQKNFTRAESTLLNLAASTTAPNLKDRAEWLALLSCLNQKPIAENCLITLKSISTNPNHSYHKPAINLNKTLNSRLGKLFN